MAIPPTPLTWTISAKKLEVGTNYRGIGQRFSLGEPSLFPVKNLNEEVKPILIPLEEEIKKANRRRLKRFAKICKITIATSALLLALVHPTFAAGTAPIAAKGLTTKVILPKDIVKVGVYLIGICAAASTILAMILTQLAGGYRMLRKDNSKAATEWTQEIMKGYTQVILAPVIIIAIAFVAFLLFGGFDWFAKPF